MVFSSVTFLFLYSLLTLATYFLLPQKYRNIFLMVVSLAFYAWGEVAFVFVMAASIIINWAFGLWINSAFGNKGRVSARTILILSVV